MTDLNTYMKNIASKTGLEYDRRSTNRFFMSKMIHVFADLMSKEEYEKMEDDIENFSLEKEGYNIFLWMDITIYEYWRECGESGKGNHIQVEAYIKDINKVNSDELKTDMEFIFRKFENKYSNVDQKF